jgi:DNA repair protein RecO (recombination protein O)
MLVTTRAIVLRSIKYSDKASAVTVFTREHGRLSVVVYGVSGRRANRKGGLLQPLSLVEMTLQLLPGREMQQLKELRSDHNLSGISVHPLKNSIALFLAELLYKSLHLQQEDQSLFDFLDYSLQWLNASEEGVANFHLVLMCKLTRYLGFEPNTLSMNLSWFDLLNGCFTANQPPHPHHINQSMTPTFLALLQCDFTSMHELTLTRTQRNELLDLLIEYYKLHLTEFRTLQSKAVLHELFD